METKSYNWNIMWLNSPNNAYLYKNLQPYQRISHFPRITDITRKDKLCVSIRRSQERWGKSAFNIIPSTYLIPEMTEDFNAAFHKNPSSVWISKPASSSQGRGIYILTDLEDLPEKGVVSKYLGNPYLINNHKFDLRVYVLIT